VQSECRWPKVRFDAGMNSRDANRVDLCVRNDNPAAGIQGPDTGAGSKRYSGSHVEHGVGVARVAARGASLVQLEAPIERPSVEVEALGRARLVAFE
jgi:hypothetical protein